MKRLMALFLAAALVFGSTVVVTAEQAEITNVPLRTTTRQFTGTGGEILGTFPAFTGNTALSQRIENLVHDTYRDIVHFYQLSIVLFAHITIFDFTIEETLTTARVEITSIDSNFNPVVITALYINKATNAEITPAVRAEMVAAEEAADEEDENGEEADENGEVAVAVEGEVEVDLPVATPMSPLRAHAEAAGFTVLWEDGAVTVYNEELSLLIVTGSDVAVLTDADGEEYTFTLAAAPVNIDGTLYVPTALLVEVLGIDLTAPAPAAAPVIADEVEEYDEYEVCEETEECDEEDEEYDEVA